MIEDGLFDRFPCDAIFAMHNLPGFRPGQLLLREGATMASSENILVHIEGKGGHGAMPHQSADPVVAGSAIVMALQTIVSRNVPPLHMAVITVGSFQSGVVNNVIPQNATLKLSVRALDRDVRELLRNRIVELVELQAKSFGVTAAFNLNLLTRLNRELGMDFDLTKFRHYASYCPLEHVARSFLVSQVDQVVHSRTLDRGFVFHAGETIYTEQSQKYSLASIEHLARRSGFDNTCTLTDPRGWYAITVWHRLPFTPTQQTST